MGIFNLFGDNKGMDCQEDPETGTLRCRRFKATKDSKITNGSSADISIDPRTCRAFFSNYSVLDEDEIDFQKVAKQREKACRGGL